MRNKIIKFCAGFIILFYGVFAFAQAKGLVPCGPGTAKEKCTWCDFGSLIENVFNFAIQNIVVPIAVAVVLWGGFLIMTAGGSPERVKKGKDAITAAVIGIVVALGAWLIIDTIIKLVLHADIGPWNEIKC